ncbi:helix-turn-helix domain-containing protein [Mycobacterium marinum]
MSNSSVNSRYLSTAEAAAYLGISQNTLRSYVHKKFLRS